MWTPTVLRHAEDVLRGRRWTVRTDADSRRLVNLAVLVVLFGMIYGAVMGSFGSFAGGGLRQVLYSAIKVPLLLMVTALLGLPSFFVINTLLGLRNDLAEALRALIATQAGLTIILASLAPFTALWYASSADYQAALMFNALMFGSASIAAQLLLRRFYRPLIERNSLHRVVLRAWLLVYAFVGIQMGWVLRPFVGSPTAPTAFFREQAWGNAYVHVVHIFWRLIGG